MSRRSWSLALVLVVAGWQTGCASVAVVPARAHRGVKPSASARLEPTRSYTAMVQHFGQRANRCFDAVFAEAMGRPASAVDRAVKPRRKRVIARLRRELTHCLSGRSYGGEQQIEPARVQRWLALKGCQAFARAAFTSNACIALQSVHEESGFSPQAPPPLRRAVTARPGPAPHVPVDGIYAASHILFQYQGASRAPAGVTTGRYAARAEAARVGRLAQKPGANFAQLAKQYSSGPTGKRGGRLGRFRLNRMVPKFSAALEQLRMGQVSGVVETRFGFHIIKRERP